MEVNVPRDRGGLVRVRDVIFQIVLRQHVVADRSVTLAFSADRGDPVQLVVLEFRLPQRVVLHKVPVRENAQQAVVANVLGFLGHVAVLARLLLPVAAANVIDGAFVERDRPVNVRERRGSFAFAGVPEDRVPHDLPVGFDWSVDLVEFAACLAAVHHLAAGHSGQNRVSGRVHEKRRGEPGLRPRVRISGEDRLDPFRALGVHFQRVHVLAQEEPASGIRTAEKDLFPRVFVKLRGVRPAGAVQGLDLVNEVSEHRVRRDVDAAAQTDADLGTVAAAQNVAVLQKQDLQTEPGRGHGGANAGHSAADHDQVVRFLRVFQSDPGFRVAESVHRLRVVWRRERGVGREVKRVAPTVEPGQVVQPDLGIQIFVRDLDGPGLLPRPRLAVRAEDFRKSLFPDEDLEFSRGGPTAPDRRPVPGASPDHVRSRLVKPGFRHAVRHGFPVAVRHHVRGAQLRHGVRVHDPPPERFEGLALDEKVRRGNDAGGEKEQNGKKNSAHLY